MNRPGAVPVVAVVLACFGGMGCNAILGNDVHDLALQGDRDAAPETSTPMDDAMSRPEADTGAIEPGDAATQDVVVADTIVITRDGAIVHPNFKPKAA